MRFVVREFDEASKSGEIFSSIGIGVKENDYLIFPSPLSNFIKREYKNKGKSINSQRNAAYAITRFLNHLSKDKVSYTELVIGGLSSLTLQHGADYISYLSLKSRAGELKSEYVKTEIQYLNKLFHWLNSESIISQSFSVDYQTVYHGRKSRKIVSNVFETTNDLDIIVPIRNSTQNNVIKDFGKNRNRLIIDFIMTAKRIEPLMALGIALQFFGGLRRSEVINLKRSSLKWTNSNLIVELRDNQDILFADAINKADIQVKYPRDQICICPEIVKPLYEEHLEMLTKLTKGTKGTKGTSEALFISTRNFNALRGKRYSAKIDKIKQQFLNDLLIKNQVEDYILLTNNKWSTHIGRGVFTNILIDLGLTPTQIALARGDRSLQSALSYVDENTLLSSMNLAIKNFNMLKEV
ncbi:site-specific integrase [Cytobacillus sp. Sa5YUA1]|uniref:Site-specific integrase n=1 Tax=Cytobacillus stercorigallinarum TaxID=2762240 RepID=A0ABR8QSR2_9BACI|nr:site-specific integrase [Cytobacillus stercorigallinarum]MBD7938528.1 site-specific integrase [Cytobacillus stercorigallinarum]